LGLFDIFKKNKSTNNNNDKNESSKDTNNSITESNFEDTKKRIEKQDKQILQFKKAEEYAKNGKVEKAIDILERIMYEEGLVINGVRWPFILYDIYYKNKMYDKCWQYLNFVLNNFPEHKGKVRERQAKVLKAEKKYKNALILKLSALLIKNKEREYSPSKDKIEKELNIYIKKAKLLDKKNKILKLYDKYQNTNNFNESKLRKDFNNIIN